MQLHPAYDPSARVWYIEDLDVEAPTLAALKILLPEDVELVGYEPNGITVRHAPSTPRDAMRPRVYNGSHSGPQAHGNTVARRVAAQPDAPRRPGFQRVFSHDNILNLWEGRSQQQVADAVGCSKNLVHKVVAEGRKKNDPRAVTQYAPHSPAVGRKSPIGAKWTSERMEYAIALRRKGYSCARIAVELGGVTRNAVIGKFHREGVT